MINSNRFKQPWPVIPFGLCCIAAFLEKEGHNVHVLDLCFSKNCARDIQCAIHTFVPDALGISIRNIDNAAGCRTAFLLDQTKTDVIMPCKKLFKGPIIIGGPSVGISGREMLEFFDLEYAVRGDGEHCITEFLKRVEADAPLEGLNGLIINRNGRIIQDLPPLYVDDLNTLPFSKPHRYIDLRPYRRFNAPLPVQTKRGCSLTCSYCTYNTIEGTHCRFRSPELIAQEIEELVHETGISSFEFTDSVFNFPLRHTKAVLRAIIEKNLSVKLHTLGLNPGAVDEELADLMKKTGFIDVDVGAESGATITLQGLAKNFTKKDIFRASTLLHDKGISITWYLLLGAPGETRHTLEETFETITTVASPWDLICIGVGIRVYKGAPIARKVLQEHPCCTADNFLRPVHYEPENIALQEIKIITKQASFKYPNFFMYDEDERISLALLIFGHTILRMLRLKMPVWKLFIFRRKIDTILGLRTLKKWLWQERLREWNKTNPSRAPSCSPARL